MTVSRRMFAVGLIAIVGASACNDDKASKPKTNASKPGVLTSSTTEGSSRTTQPSGPAGVLTGAPADAVAATRPALTVKVENTRSARPQTGLEFADVVYEEVVEGGITRLAVVYQSQVPAVVGPVRSVRKTDQAIVRPLQGIFVYSGGAPYAEQSIATAPVVRFNESKAGRAMFRDRSRKAPHNLYLRGADIYTKATQATGPPQALFNYATPSTTAGMPAIHAVVGFRGDYAVVWDWDAAARRWQRSIFGRPDVSTTGVRLGATNVVIQQVRYVGGVTSGPKQGFGAEAQLVGTGSGWVLTNGRVIAATWKRTAGTDAGEWADAAGTPLTLAPGTTWIELPERSYSIDIR